MSGNLQLMRKASIISKHPPLADYSIFADPSFNPHQYAHRVLAGESSSLSLDGRNTGLTITASPSHYQDSSLAKEDISLAITKLNLGLEDVSKQMKSVVS